MTKRIISAIVLVLLIVPLLYIGGLPFNILLSALSVCALYEMFHMKETQAKLPLIIKIIAYILVVFLTYNTVNIIDLQYHMDYKIMTFLIFVFLCPIVFVNDFKKYNISDALYIIGSVLFIGLSFSLLVALRNYDLKYILYLALITIVTDTFALFTGRLVGKHKLTTISPNKTIEGSIGGSLMGTFVAVAFYHTVINPSLSLVFIIFVTLGLSVVGQIGDLVFSSIKRYYGMKDFSDLIPGHGGILDRFDSMIFVVLAFTMLIGII